MTVRYFGEDAVFHHIGIAVSSLNRVVDSEHPRWDDEVQGVRVAFVDLSGAPIELIEPLSEASPISNALSSGRPLVHICFQVSSLSGSISEAGQHGFHLLGTPTPAAAFVADGLHGFGAGRGSWWKCLNDRTEQSHLLPPSL